MTDQSNARCVCGRPTTADPTRAIYSPQRAEIMQRLGTIRESRMRVVCTSPIDNDALASLAAEERELRARLARLVHANS